MEVRGNQVDIRIGVTAGCAACASGKGCGAGIFARLWRRKSMLLTVESTLPVFPGQSVIVGIADRIYLRLVARLYVLPLFAALGGAMLGHWLGARIPLGGTPSFMASDALAVMGAGTMCAIAVWFLKYLPGPDSGGIAVELVRVESGLPGIQCGNQISEQPS